MKPREYQIQKGDKERCIICGNDRCSGCGNFLRHKEFTHVFHGEDVCHECQKK